MQNNIQCKLKQTLKQTSSEVCFFLLCIVLCYDVNVVIKPCIMKRVKSAFCRDVRSFVFDAKVRVVHIVANS